MVPSHVGSAQLEFEICFLGHQPFNKIYAIVDTFDDCLFILDR